MLKNIKHLFSSTQLNHTSKAIREYAQKQYDRGLEYYIRRIELIGFTDLKHVLDAASGCGQWSVALALNNQFVSSIEIDPEAIEISNKVKETLEIDNLQFIKGDIHHFPFRDNSVDAILTYSALMYTKENFVIKEFSRILKNRGKVYICSDGPAWPFHRILNDGFKERKYRHIFGGLKLIIITCYYRIIKKNSTRKLTYLRKRDIVKLLLKNNIKAIYYGPEGSYKNKNQSQFKPIFGDTFLGLPVDFEIIGEKFN